jgi:hypothetical protein
MGTPGKSRAIAIKSGRFSEDAIMGGFDISSLAVSCTVIRLEKYRFLMQLGCSKVGMCWREDACAGESAAAMVGGDIYGLFSARASTYNFHGLIAPCIRNDMYKSSN